jgi:hypothetical protein
MKLKKILAGHLLALVLALPNMALAEDFTINLGINASKLDETVRALSTICVVRNSEAGKIGSTSKVIDVNADGTLKTNFAVKFNADSGKNPAEATNFNCKLSFVVGSQASSVLAADDPACKQAANQFKCAKPGTKLVTEFNGPIT